MRKGQYYEAVEDMGGCTEQHNEAIQDNMVRP